MRKKRKVLRKLIAALLLNVFSLNIFADGLQIDPNSRYNTSLDRSQNGVPIVNISTPNGYGVSINEFLEYNVGNEGQVLNNADNLGRSYLAGIINANPNLGPNQAANLILLQVNGANRSQIEGYIEALSRNKVNVILSNENGIYLNGAGTINIKNFIPTTGRVVIGADGFDATNTDYVNVISKAMELHGNLVGNKVDVTLGENIVDSDGTVTSKNGINSVAIDASNLGSMYAGQVKIVSTDKGAGVNSDGLIYSKDTTLEITADGIINVSKIKGNGIEINGTEYAQTELASSDKGIDINASKIRLAGETQANGDINLNGNVENKSNIYTGGNLNTFNMVNSGNINVSGDIVTGDFKNSLATVLSGGNFNVKNLESSGNIQVTGITNINGKFDNTGTLTSVKKISISGDIDSTGDILTNEDLSINGKLENDGTVETSKSVKVSGDIRNSGKILSNGDLNGKNTVSTGDIVSKNITVDDLKNDGKISATENINAKKVTNTGDVVAAGTISSDDMVTSGTVKSNKKITVSGKLENAGTVETSEEIKVSGNIRNDGNIVTNENLSGKNTENNGSIYAKNLKINNLKNDGKIESMDLKTDDVVNSGDITAIGKVTSNNIDNSGKLLANDVINAKNIKNIDRIASGKGITGKRIDNSGTFATNGDIKATDSFVNSGTVDGREIEIAGTEFTNSGKISADNIKAKVVNTKNDGSVYSGNDIDLTTTTLINTKEISAVNNINATNANITNNGKIASNNKVLLDNSSITNTGEILSNEIFMRNSQKFDNAGTIKGNKTELSINQDINLVGNIHGQQRLVITGNNITNNGNTTGTGLIEINSDDFTNNRELAADTVTVNGRGEIINNSMITGNNGKISGNNITNNDLIAFENKLEIDSQNKVQNNRGKAIYGGQELIIKGNEIMNDEAEILGGNMNLDAAKITNNVATIQSTGNIVINSSDFQNIGRVSNLGSYEKYYETWDGKQLSEAEVRQSWLYHNGNDWDKTSSGSRGQTARREQREWLEAFIRDTSNIKSLLLTKYESDARRALNNGYQKLESETARYPEEALTGKLRSNATTEYGKVLASGNITINSGDFKNKDSIVSGGGLVDITATNFENSVTLGNAVQLQKGKERLELEIRRYRRRGRPRVKMVAYFNRELTLGDVGYESGQPSIIEGGAVNINAPNIVRNPVEAGNGVTLNNGGATGKALISSTSAGVKKGISSVNGQIKVTGNTLLPTLSSNFDRAVQIAGNNSGIKDIKDSGIISVNPILSSAMFTTNMNPSSKYLMETRSKYISLGLYYGSDYFTSRVGYSEIWDRTKRLGDAYYENQLLTKTLSEKLGTAFINGKSNQELIQSMMDNAATEGTRLGLTVGQELTQEQINNLNEDIVWYVTKEVNGVEVLTPQVYLSSRSRESISADTRNRVGGIEGTYVKTKDFVNDGAKWGNGGTTIVEADTVRNETATNLLSEISGNKTLISAAGNIENIGGLIKGTEELALISQNGSVINNTTKRTVGYNSGELNRTQHERIAAVGAITSEGTTFIKAGSYETTGGILNTNHLVLDVERLDGKALTLTGEDKFGSGSDNYSRYREITNIGSVVSAASTSGRIGDMNLTGSSFIGGDTRDLTVTGNVNVESSVNIYENESMRTDKGFMSSASRYVDSHQEENGSGNLQLSGARIEGDVTGIGSNIVLGENTFVRGKVTTDSRQLHNSYYEENKSRGFTGGISGGTVSAGYGKSRSTYDEKSVINAGSNLVIGDGSVLNNGAEITATNFEYGNIEINNGDVKYGARIDTKDVHTSSKSSNFGVSIGINSPIIDRAKQIEQAVNQSKGGDTAGGAMEAINAVTGTIKGLASNQGNRQTRYDENGSVGRSGVKDAQANNNFYGNIGVNVGFSKSKSSTNSHIENAVVTTLNPLNENSSITYNNVKNITYQGTQAQGGTFIYNNVENIQKEAVELNNSYSSSSSNRGISAGTTIGYGHKMQTTGNGISLSAGRSNSNTTETIYENGNFNNVNEVHNNTKNMTLRGFNQEGGKVTGTIGNLEVTSLQNTSTTTGSSRGMSVGISSSGIPNSIGLNYSSTNGERGFVDNQSSFIVGEGSNFHVGTLENTGAVIGKEGNSVFKADKYIGHDLQNTDTMKTTGGSIEISTEKPRITNVGFNQDSRDKQGITRNTVIGDVEIGEASGSPINRDITRANEVTRDTHSSTNINVESQTIEYLTNPARLKEDLTKAKNEISDVATAIKESLNDRGDDNRNFFGQLRARRQDITMNNISHTAISNIKDKFDKGQISEKEFQEGLKYIAENTGKDLGVATEIFYTDTENMPNDAKDRRAVVKKDETGKYQIYIDMKQIDSTSNLIGTVFEEISHSIDEKAGRQQEMTQEQKDRGEYGLESLGRPTNDYFKEQYKDNGKEFISKGDGLNYSDVVGETIGNDIQIKNFENDKEYKEQIKELVSKRFLLYFKDNFRNSKGKFDEETGKKIINDIQKMVDNGEIFADINNVNEIVEYYQLRDKEGNKINDIVTYTKNEDSNAVIKLDVENNPNYKNNMIDDSLRSVINDEEYTTYIKVIERDKDVENDYKKIFEKHLKKSKISKKNKEEILKSYEFAWNSVYQPVNYTIAGINKSIVLINKGETEYEIITQEKEGEKPVYKKIDSIQSIIRHETQHSEDKSEEIKKGTITFKKSNPNTQIVEKNGNVYSSDNYYIENENIFFYSIRKKEFNTVNLESEIQKKLNLPNRRRYSNDDPFIKIPYDKNNPEDINKLFEKAMKLYEK